MSEVVGRQDELAALEALIQRLGSGPGALVLYGDAGIGKTTLWREGIAAARKGSLAVLSCRPIESETQLPYAGLGDLFTAVDDGVLTSLPAPQRSALDVALLRVRPEGPALDPRAVATATLGVLTRLAHKGPVVVAIDDVQWLDVPSTRALSFALRRLGDLPMRALVTVRGRLDSEAPLGLTRAVPEDRLTSLEVGPLSIEALDHLLRSRLDTAFAPPVQRQLHRLSEGNPFFALELGRALLRRQAPLRPGEALPVPGTLRGLVTERLADLSDAAQDALRVASALARPTVALLRAVSTGEGVDEALAGGVLDVDDGKVRFTHPLLASVLHSEASAEARRRLHHRLAEVVTDPDERARHLALGAEGADAEVASALDEAARRASTRGAPDVAATLSAQAARLTPEDDAPEDQRRRRLQAADSWFTAGEMAQARTLLESVLAESAGSARGRVLERLGAVQAQEAGFGAAAGTFRAALAEAGEDSWLRASLECDLAYATLVSGDIAGGADHARAALVLADTLSDPPPLLLSALIFVLHFDFLEGKGIDAKLLERAVELEDDTLAGRIDGRPGFLHVPHVPANLLKWTGCLDAARSRYLSAYRRMVEVGDESSLAFLCYHMSELECWAGAWDLAARYASQTAATAEWIGQDELRAGGLYTRALVEAHRGEIKAARELAEEGLALCERTGHVPFTMLILTVLGFLALSEGEPAEAHRRLGPMAQLLAVMALSEPAIVRFLPDEVEALVALGELDQAGALLDPFEERARALDRTWALAAGARARGLLLAGRGDLPGALAALDSALKDHARLPQPFDLGRTLLVQGIIRRRAKQKRLARESLEEARGIFESLGAALWAEKARGELARIGGRAPAPAELSPTEAKMAELVAMGHTNQEVADLLYTSAKTVESNLSRIYRKLGVGSRRELARLLRERTS